MLTVRVLRRDEVVDEVLIAVSSNDCNRLVEIDDKKKCLQEIKVDPILASCFACELRRSSAYRRAVIECWFSRRLEEETSILALHLENDEDDGSRNKKKRKLGPFLGSAWSDRLQRLVNLRIELDNLSSWLSTLGGAFSALGDIYERCALMAGKISYHQWRLAQYCDDEIMAAKCKIFAAVSLAQRGHFRMSATLVRQQLAFARSLPESCRDERLEKMCLGVWAKLKYLRSLQIEKEKKRKLMN